MEILNILNKLDLYENTIIYKNGYLRIKMRYTLNNRNRLWDLTNYRTICFDKYYIVIIKIGGTDE